MTDLAASPEYLSVGIAPSASTELGQADFQAIFVAQLSYVWKSLRRLGVRPADVEDVTHDVFLTVHQRLADYDPRRPIKPWLFGIAYRTAARYRDLARHKREIFVDPDQSRDEQRAADEQLIGFQERQLLEEALDTLDLEKRAVFVMHDIDEISMPRVAETLALPLNTAYSRLRLAREGLRAAAKRLRARRGEQ